MRQALRYRLEAACSGKVVTVSQKVGEVHPISERIAIGLSKLDVIRYIKITPDFLAASSEVKGITRDPIATPGHPTATGISIIFLSDYKYLDFYEINAARKGKGYGRKMVMAVFDALPSDWKATVTMDSSDGFWEKMRRSYPEKLELDGRASEI
ncbi:MAG: hypothetical protein HY077_00045 [Elusimicrobia bacterium]|nr:hypothetical protein [Elusimicrobiota bacterium]